MNLLKISLLVFSFILLSHSCFSNDLVNNFLKEENLEHMLNDYKVNSLNSEESIIKRLNDILTSPFNDKYKKATIKDYLSSKQSIDWYFSYSPMHASYYDPHGYLLYLDNLKERTMIQNFQLLMLKHVYLPESVGNDAFNKDVTTTHESLKNYFESQNLEKDYHLRMIKESYYKKIGVDYFACYTNFDCFLGLLPEWYDSSNETVYLPCELAQKYDKVAYLQDKASPLNCFSKLTSDCPLHEKYRYHPDLEDYIAHVFYEGIGYVEYSYQWLLVARAEYEYYTKKYVPDFNIETQHDWGKFPHNEWSIQSYYTFKKFNKFINYGIGYQKALEMLTNHYIHYFNVEKEKAYNRALYVLTLSVFKKSWPPIQPDNIKYLLLTGADWEMIEKKHPNIQNYHDLLRYSIEYPKNLEKLIQMGKKTKNFNINVGDEDLSKTALMWAAQYGYIKSVKLLVENGADLNQQTSENIWCNGINASVSNLCVHNKKRTALMYAAQEGHEEIVRYLIEKGADKNITDTRGKTAYHYMIGEAPWKNPYYESTIGVGMTTSRSANEQKTLFTDEQIRKLTPLLLPDLPLTSDKEY